MDITVQLSNGLRFNANGVDFVAADSATHFNSPQTQAITIGGFFIPKHTLHYIVPKEQEANPTVAVYLNNGQAVQLAVTDFSAEELADKYNQTTNLFINIGNGLFNRNVIGPVIPLDSAV